MIVDGHVHVWGNDPEAFPWRPIHGSTPPLISGSVEYVLDVLEAHGVGSAVAVQSRVYGDDHSYLADARRRFPDRIAAVASVDPRRAESASHLAELVADGFAGLRLDVIGWGVEPLLDGTVLRLWDRAADLEIPIEVLVLPAQLAALRPLVDRTRRTPVVIEHAARYLASPDDPIEAVCELASASNVHVKVSALAAISREPPPHRDLWPLLRMLTERFGPDRLLWGSDMPWIGAGWYGPELDAITELPWLDDAGRAALLGETARRLFGVPGETDRG